MKWGSNIYIRSSFLRQYLELWALLSDTKKQLIKKQLIAEVSVSNPPKTRYYQVLVVSAFEMFVLCPETQGFIDFPTWTWELFQDIKWYPAIFMKLWNLSISKTSSIFKRQMPRCPVTLYSLIQTRLKWPHTLLWWILALFLIKISYSAIT